MKYKVILLRDSNAGGQPDGTTAAISFYTKAQAQNACSQWTEISSINVAFLWDGSQWTAYTP